MRAALNTLDLIYHYTVPNLLVFFFFRSMRDSQRFLTPEQLCEQGQAFCPGRYNVGVCERGFLGEDRHDEHFGRSCMRP
jgi:hypothetical protein